MVPVDRNSSEYQRDMALQYLDEHKNALAFRSRLSEDTAASLGERGCLVSRPDSDGVCTVTSTVPFGRLMTSGEKRARRLQMVGGITYAIFFFGGIRVVYLGALYLGLGEGTAILWFLGWIVLSGIVLHLMQSKLPSVDRMSEAHSDVRSILPYLTLIVLLFFCAGVLVHLVGWSGN
jgi:hypothetical protein